MNGCTDFHSGERPYDYGQAIWTAESLDIWFLVKNTYDDYGGYMYPEGEMSVGDETVSFTVDFDKGISVFLGVMKNLCLRVLVNLVQRN